jgi:ATP-dependent exoDNAse (exonuclease V) beta subunit
LHSPFSIYDASAGSGKTFTVVREYLKILLNSTRNDAFRNILAITFTNKAATEMKTRIVNNLREFSQTNQNSEMFQQLQKETGMTARELRKKAGAILKNLLHNYAAFEISTIDGFTHRLLRTFAKDLQLPVNFEVEMETDLLLSETVDRLLAKTGIDQKLTEVLVDFALSKTDDDKSWDISRDLNEISKLLTNENNLRALEKLDGKNLSDFKNFRKKLSEEIAIKKKGLIKAGAEFLEWIENNGLAQTDFTGSYAPKYFKKLINGDFKVPNPANWRDNIEDTTLYNKKTPEASKQIIDNLQSEIAKRYRFTEKLLLKIAFYEKILGNLTALSLLNSIYQELQDVKKEKEVLPIFEFNRKIAESIQGQPAPFIYERLGERYHHFFIDEFQDTSLLQWANLQPLIDNSLSAASEENPGSLTIVGDAKQAIYRWRGGKAEQLMLLSAEGNDGNPFSVKKKSKRLKSNFRSRKEVVDFNTEFFQHCAKFLSNKAYQDLFEQADQKPIQEAGGYVELSFLEAENKEAEMEVFPEKTHSIIEDLNSEGHQLRDMAVLVRKRQEGVAIAQKLSEHNIPIVSSETLLLKNAPEVNFMVKVLEFTQNPSENNLKYQLLDVAWKNEWITDKNGRYALIEKMIQYEGPAFFEAWEDYNIQVDLKQFQQLPLYDGVEYLFRSFQLMNGSNAYVHYFLDLVYEYNQNKSAGLTGFLEFWHEQSHKLSVAAPEGENAVQIMTIHKSKGLEFPIVIYPFANQQIDDTGQDSVWVELEENDEIPLAYMGASKKMLEYNEGTNAAYTELTEQNELDNLNLFYVTMTRACEQLYILSKRDLGKNEEEKTNRLSGLLINFLKEKNRWEPENLSFGQKPEPIQQKKEGLTSVEIPLSSHKLDNSSIDVITRSGEFWDSDSQKAIEEGNLIHELLGQIKQQGDLERTLEKAVKSGMISKEDINFYDNCLCKIIQHPKLKKFFSGDYHIYNEKEIIQRGEFFRLDRLCIHRKTNSASIIDYKTGQPKKRDLRQIERYAALLREMNYEISDKILVYIEDGVKPKFV